MRALRRHALALVALASSGAAALVGASCVAPNGDGMMSPHEMSGSDAGPPGIGSPGNPASDGGTPEASLFEPVDPSSALAKVKNLLVGVPPTDAEVSSIKASLAAGGPTAAVRTLKTFIHGWIGQDVAAPLSPQNLTGYQSKMLGFFANAFQQSQTTTYDLTILNGITYAYPQQDALLLADMQQMFALTVLATTASNGGTGSFADVIDTKQFMMTPALASYYAFLDNQIFDDEANFSDRMVAANPGFGFNLTGSPVPIGSAVASMTFFNAAISAGNTGVNLSQDQWTTCLVTQPWAMNTGTSNQEFVTDELFFALSGYQVGGFLSGAGTAAQLECLPAQLDYATYAGSFYMQPADFANWSMVSIRQPNAGEATLPFYDLPSMRGLPGGELVLHTPRVGYYTTQAFLAEWNTNASNQARVTVNQTMIVGLGKAFDTSNAADVSRISSAAVDPMHASQAACNACHETLDPMRQFFRQAYSLNFSVQTADAEAAMPGQFAFDGVTHGGDLSIYDLGRLIKTHPDFAGAWVQKLCTYATSSICDDRDPEFKRIVEVFKSSNYNWTTLVTELFSSPIVTFLAETVSSDELGETFPITRATQLCSLLSTRLATPDICGLLPTAAPTGYLAQVQALIAAMPSDQYSRGSTLPVLANDPSLFFRAGIENICINIASALVDSSDGGVYSSATPDTAIANLVTQLMGLTADRAGGAADGPMFILKNHFNKAMAQQGLEGLDAGTEAGAMTAADALRSTFVLACESPYVAGVGQ